MPDLADEPPAPGPCSARRDIHRDDWVVALREDVVQRPGHPDETFAPAGASSTPARSSSWPSTTRSGSAASASTATPAAASSIELPGRALRQAGRGPAGHRRARAAGGGRAAGRALAAPADALPERAGITTELHHIYLAHGLSHADRGDFELHAEEAELEVVWVPFEELLEAVLDGRVQEGPMAAAVLAYDVLTPRRSSCDGTMPVTAVVRPDRP